MIELDQALDAAASKVKVAVSPNPNVQLGPALDSLVDYPHGCVEQTSSRLFALLEAEQMARSADPARAQTIHAMIDGGISRLWAMQTSGGGLSYWPGSQNPDAWGTVYAADFLAKAHAAGCVVDERFLKLLTDYMTQRLASTRGESAAIDDNTRAHMCDVLAKLGHHQPGWVATLRERASQLDIGGRAHLASALHEAGKTDLARAVLAADTVAMTVATSTSGRLTSQTVQLAELLQVLLRVDPASPWVPMLAEKLNAARVNGAWSSTVENAASLVALSAYSRTAGVPAPCRGTLRTATETLPLSGEAAVTRVFAAKEFPVAIELEPGSGQGFAIVTMRGRTLRMPEPFDRGLRVRRTWSTAGGEAVNPASIRVGDLIMVQVSLAAPGVTIDQTNIAVVDLLPSGFEVENPALATSAVAAKERAMPDRIEFHSDRVVIFTAAQEQVRSFAYFIRATSAGHSVLPPIQATSMYEAGLGSLSGESTVLEVKP